MTDLDIIAQIRVLSHIRDGPICSGYYWRATGRRDVDAGMHCPSTCEGVPPSTESAADPELFSWLKLDRPDGWSCSKPGYSIAYGSGKVPAIEF